MSIMRTCARVASAVVVAVACASAALLAQPRPGRADATGVISGAVTSAKGPEAGVWVIAESNDFRGSTFRKIVVTDDRGRYLLPDLPRSPAIASGYAAMG